MPASKINNFDSTTKQDGFCSLICSIFVSVAARVENVDLKTALRKGNLA